MDGDVIMFVCGKYMKEQGALKNNKVVTTIMSNFGLYKALDREGIGYEKTAVGDKYVYENMVTYGNCLGGEQSGHIIFSKHATTGDGILTSLKVMEVMLEKKESLAKLASEIEIYPQVLKNVRVKDKAAAQDDAVVKAEVSRVTEALGDSGRILLRQSGTEPVAVSYTHLDVYKRQSYAGRCLRSPLRNKRNYRFPVQMQETDSPLSHRE